MVQLWHAPDKKAHCCANNYCFSRCWWITFIIGVILVQLGLLITTITNQGLFAIIIAIGAITCAAGSILACVLCCRAQRAEDFMSVCCPDIVQARLRQNEIRRQRQIQKQSQLVQQSAVQVTTNQHEFVNTSPIDYAQAGYTVPVVEAFPQPLGSQEQEIVFIPNDI